ncbi:MAG: hypothetical protein Q8865_08705 [Bacillota bacterium]|nr:hypothetical protein [Bacillota bacterium]
MTILLFFFVIFAAYLENFSIGLALGLNVRFSPEKLILVSAFSPIIACTIRNQSMITPYFNTISVSCLLLLATLTYINIFKKNRFINSALLILTGFAPLSNSYYASVILFEKGFCIYIIMLSCVIVSSILFLSGNRITYILLKNNPEGMGFLSVILYLILATIHII